MKQLTVGSIMKFVTDCMKNGMTAEELKDLPIYIGNDDELNGIHCAWYTNLLDANDTTNTDNAYMVEMINEDRCNIKIEGKAILIS